MERELLAFVMLISIVSAVALTLVLWQFEKIRRRRDAGVGLRRFLRSDGSPVDHEPTDDPYDVSVNDEDIL